MDAKQHAEYAVLAWINSRDSDEIHHPLQEHNFCTKRWQKPINKGFTLVEVLVAGSILLMVMVGVSRVSVQSITSGRNRMERDRIEAAIHNNIQLIQQADSKLTLESIP